MFVRRQVMKTDSVCMYLEAAVAWYIEVHVQA